MLHRDTLAVAILCFTASQLSAQASVADDALVKCGLTIAPADAAFFMSWSRQEEQFNIIRESRSLKRLLEVPNIRESFKPLFAPSSHTDDPELIAFRDWLAQPAVQVALDALSHEVFVYGDASFTQTIENLHQLSAARANARLDALARGKSEDEAKKIAGRAVRPIMSQLKLPAIVVGMKVKDRDAARTQMTQLSELIQSQLDGDDVPPQYRARNSKETVHGQVFQTLSLDASMLPLKNNPDSNADPEAVEAFANTLRSLTLVLAIGMHEDYVILSVGPSINHLRKLGQGPTLIDHPDVELIKQHADKRLTSIRYTASHFRAQLKSQNNELAGLSEYLAEKTKEHDEVSDATRKKVQDALAAIKLDLGQDRSQQPPAVIGFTFMTDDGFEGFDYNAVDLEEQDGALTVLDHVGDDPLVVLAGHSGINVESYQKWMSRFDQTSGKININGSDAGVVLQQFRGFVAKLSGVVQEDLIPAIENGQAALVVSARDSSEQWHPNMPKASQPLLLPEASLVLQVKDRAQLLKGIAKAYGVANELMDALVQMADGDPALEQMKLPDAVIEETQHAKVYAQPLSPDFTNIPPNTISPSAGISDQWLVLSPRPSEAKRLLSPGTFGERFQHEVGERHARSVAYVNVARMLQLVAQWYSYAEQLSPLPEDASTDDINARQFYRAAFELTSCLQTYQRVTYVEGGASVIHTVWKFEDRP